MWKLTNLFFMVTHCRNKSLLRGVNAKTRVLTDWTRRGRRDPVASCDSVSYLASKIMMKNLRFLFLKPNQKSWSTWSTNYPVCWGVSLNHRVCINIEAVDFGGRHYSVCKSVGIFFMYLLPHFRLARYSHEQWMGHRWVFAVPRHQFPTSSSEICFCAGENRN